MDLNGINLSGVNLKNTIFETHAHYDDGAFDSDRSQLLEDLPNHGVFRMVNASADLISSRKSVELSRQYPYIYAAVGVHPENLPENEKFDFIDELKGTVLDNEKVVAIGEIGLDYHYRTDNKDIQKIAFLKQIELANELDLPVVVHDRDAHGDTLEILEKTCPKGVVHCFSGSVEMAKKVIDLGMYLGVGGVVTFRNAKNIARVIRDIPLETVVLETDAPYLAPEPFRGKRCDSSMIKYTAQKVAEIKGISIDEVLRITKLNAMNLFDMK